MGAVSKTFFGLFGPEFGLNIRGGGGGGEGRGGEGAGGEGGEGGTGPFLDPPLNRKASGLRCKFATKLITCSPVILSPGTV